MSRKTKRLLTISTQLIKAIEDDTELFIQERPFLLPDEEQQPITNLSELQRASKQTIRRLIDEVIKVV